MKYFPFIFSGLVIGCGLDSQINGGGGEFSLLIFAICFVASLIFAAGDK